MLTCTVSGKKKKRVHPSPLLMSVPCVIHVLTLHRNSFLRKSSVLSEWTLCEEERGEDAGRREGGRLR